MTVTDPLWTRRAFVRGAASCAAHVGLMTAAAPWLPRRLWAQERFSVVAREPWGRLERIAEGVWALVSTPLDGDRTTLCNGGIVAGRSGVLVVEAFGTDAGSTWMAERARELTGRAPTHVVVTHYHADHTAGLRGAIPSGSVTLLSTEVTRGLVAARNQDPPKPILDGAEVIDGRRPSEVDLGGRSVLVVPRDGHTDSDVSLELTDPRVIFCGDLVWNRMFPNYVDAIPSRLSANVRLLRALGAATYVPGHGPIADPGELDRYQELLDDVEAAARRAIEEGRTAEEAGAAYRIPDALGAWTLFNPAYFGRAIGAWMKELGA